MNDKMKSMIDEKLNQSQNKSELSSILTPRINPEVQSMLDVMIKMEYESSFKYYYISACLMNNNISQTSKLFKKYGDEEQKHAEKHLEYVDDRNGKQSIPTISTFDFKCDCVKEALLEALKHERMVSDTYISSYKKLFEIGDITTLDHVSWYVHEQKEEEVKVRELLEKYYHLEECGGSLFHWEKEVESMLG